MKKRELLTVVSTALVSTSILLLLQKLLTNTKRKKQQQDKTEENRLITKIQKDEARRRLPVFVWKYISYDSGEGRTKTHVRDSFSRYKLLPRILVEASKTTTSTKLFSKKTLKVPLLVAPTAFHSLYHPRGEEATAMGTSEAQVGYCYNISLSNVDINTVSRSSTSIKWAHLYLWKDRKYVLWQVKLAERLGFDAIIVTCDHPHDRVKHATMPWFAPHEDKVFPGRRETLREIMTFPNLSRYQEEMNIQNGESDVAGINDDTLTFRDLKWLCECTSLPVVCKGVLSPKDAISAVEAGCHGVCVSNHGGRQLDRAVPAIDALRNVVNALKDKDDVIVLVDSGFRTSTDILIALALGAHAVMLGRPVLWALASDGASGVQRLFDRLREELLCDMKSLGVASVEELRRRGGDLLLKT